MGAAYVMFLPVIGFAMVFDFLGRRAFRGVRSGTLAMAAVVSPRWRPGEAYLAKEEKERGRRGKATGGREEGRRMLNVECRMRIEGGAISINDVACGQLAIQHSTFAIRHSSIRHSTFGTIIPRV